MAERCGTGKRSGSGRAAAAAGKRPSAPAGERRLHEPVLDLLEELAVRCPLRVPQARRGMHCSRDLEPFQLGPERVVVGMVQISAFEKHRPDKDSAET